MGGGLGGGSSNAATTLLALNCLWELNLPINELSSLGLALGADVPVFVEGHSAFAEGIGEKLTSTPELPEPWYLVACPPISVDRKSTRLNSSHVRISYAVFCLKKKKKTT